MKPNPAYLSMKCPQCGSPSLRYSPDRRTLLCDHCGYSRELPRGQNQVRERALSEGFSFEGLTLGLGAEMKEYECDGCGAHRAMTTGKSHCPFCGRETVHEAEKATQVVQPAGIMPFTIPRKKAEGIFAGWLKQGWFYPSNLGKLARLENLSGVYLPFWTFDAYTRSTWHAEAGFRYTAAETGKDAQGKPQTRAVEKVRWEPVSGYLESFFDDVLVLASKGLPQSGIDKIGPFDLSKVVNYDGRYLLGWECELYQKDLKEGLKEGEKKIEGLIREAVVKKIPGDTFQNLKIQTQKEGLTFKHILLPVWVASYRYKGKLYRFLINGYSGKVAGDKPWSTFKIAMAALGAILLIVGAVYASDALMS